ncbi:MAG: SpoIIE family protein phosphatase [Leptospiraceae bacterium]|nr:SpoIIE family protein phosphatase [Leptospiraceae bacterium]
MNWKPRLSLQIGLLYTALAVINIAFFAFMILENQLDLLQNTFRYHSRSLVQSVMNRTSDLNAGAEQGSYESLEELLREYDTEYGIVFDGQGSVLHRWNSKKMEGKAQPIVEPQILDRARELRGKEMLFRERFSIELNEDDWSADVILPLGQEREETFVNIRMRIAAMEERLGELYWQVALAILWGIVFHIIFGIFVYRIIFRRLSLLEEASRNMHSGDLTARADWSFVRGDELDDLGQSFNDMALSIEEKVQTIESQLVTISRLNLEMQNELDIGQDVQRAFFPNFSAFQDYNPAFVFLPLRQVSGDMCGLHRFSDGDVGVFLGDAAGHGVSGALITALVTSAMDALLPIRKEPSPLLESLNAGLCGRLTSTFYATGIYVLIRSESLIFSGAGHVNCFLYRRREDSFLPLESQGTPIGLFEDMRYPQLTVSYSKGDRLVLFSDGLTEAMSETSAFGLDGVEAMIRSTLQLSGRDLEDQIRQTFLSFRKSDADDVTVLALDL